MNRKVKTSNATLLKPGGKTVDAVYQVDGVGDEDHRKHSERYADISRKLVYTE